MRLSDNRLYELIQRMRRRAQPEAPVKVERVYTIEMRVTGTEADHMRVKHNVAQHAVALGVLNGEIDDEGKTIAYSGDWFVSAEEIETAARLDQCTLAKALNSLPFEEALAIVQALLRADYTLVAHPGIMGWTKLNADLVVATLRPGQGWPGKGAR